MLVLIWRLSIIASDFLHTYMPTNRAISWLRTPRGLKWAIPAALIATPTYLFVMVLAVAIIDGGGPGWLHLVFLWAFWNATKFAWMAVISLALMLGWGLRRLLRETRSPRPVLR